LALRLIKKAFILSKFGSGWAWITVDGKIEEYFYINQDNPWMDDDVE
jgi:superoxide dismutase